MSSHCLLSSVSWSTVIAVARDESCFPLCFQDCLFDSLIIMCPGVALLLQVYPSWSSLSFWYVSIVFIKFGDFLVIIFSNFLSGYVFSLSGTLIMHWLVNLMLSHSYFSSFFLFLTLHNFNRHIIQFVHSSTCSDLLLTPLVKALFQLLYFSALNFSLIPFYWYSLLSEMLFLSFCFILRHSFLEVICHI